MATVKFNPIIACVSGRIGEFIIKNRGGKAYFSKRPDLSKRILSSAQKDSVKRFRAAVAFAKATMKDPIALLVFQEKAKKTGIPVYNTIISEYMKEDQAKAKVNQQRSNQTKPLPPIVPERPLKASDEKPDSENKPEMRRREEELLE